MEYQVTMTTHVPETTPDAAVDDVRVREAACSRRRTVLSSGRGGGPGRCGFQTPSTAVWPGNRHRCMFW